MEITLNKKKSYKIPTFAYHGTKMSKIKFIKQNL